MSQSTIINGALCCYRDALAHTSFFPDFGNVRVWHSPQQNVTSGSRCECEATPEGNHDRNKNDDRQEKTKSTQTLNLTGKMDSKTKHQHCVYKNEQSVCLWMWMTSGSDENLRWSAVKCTSCLNGNCHHVQSQLCLLFPIGAIWTPGINTLILRYGNLLRRLILKRW